jgi:hypothetical protein
MANKHPGFQKVAQNIASAQGLPFNRAKAILATRTRSASPVAKKANPNLKKVKG